MEQTFCTNSLTTAADGTSIYCASLHLCSSYGLIFLNSYREHALIELFFGLHLSFRRLVTFPCIYLFSNLAFC